MYFTIQIWDVIDYLWLWTTLHKNLFADGIPSIASSDCSDLQVTLKSPKELGMPMVNGDAAGSVGKLKPKSMVFLFDRDHLLSNWAIKTFLQTWVNLRGTLWISFRIRPLITLHSYENSPVHGWFMIYHWTCSFCRSYGWTTRGYFYCNWDMLGGRIPQGQTPLRFDHRKVQEWVVRFHAVAGGGLHFSPNLRATLGGVI